MRNIDPRRLEALRTVERAYRDMVVRSLSVPDEEILKEPGVGPKTLRKRRRADIERWTFARGSRMAYERGGGFEEMFKWQDKFNWRFNK